MEVDPSTQPGLEPVRHPNNFNNPKPENSAYSNYGGPPTNTVSPNGSGIPYGGSPQNVYSSPQNSYATPNSAYGNGSADPYATQAVQEKGHSPGRRICGLAATTFALLVALIVCIVAAAVGGGIGGTLAVNNAKTACLKDSAVTVSALSAALASATGTKSPTTTPKASGAATSSATSAKATSTAATATEPWGAVGTDIGLSLCPDKEGQIYTSVNGPAKFKIFCDGDQPGFDLFQTLVTTMALCLEACANWNLSPSTSAKCKGGAYVASDIDGSNGKPVNCYLKSVANSSALTPNTYVVDYGIIQ